MSDADVSQPLVWIDLEMTGLDPASDRILEIATILTDGDLNVVEEGPDLIVHQPEDVLQSINDVVRSMHTSSGLLEAVGRSTLSVAQAEAQTLGFIRRHVPEPATAPLAGNSIHVDRSFLERAMPELIAHLHYRIIDVSTVKELARRWHPEALDAAPNKAGGHRALADVRESIVELRHYRRTLFS